MDKNKVLFVDDEVNVISAIRRGVAEEPYQSFFASSAQEALTIMEKHEISVLVTDMRMPGTDGLTLLKIVKEKYPRTVRAVLSGYTQLSQMLATINQGEIFKFIAKPWTTDEDLLPAVRQAIDYYNLQTERDALRESLEQRNFAYQKILRMMEQKLAEEKEELQNLKEISRWIFSFWRQNITLAAGEERLTKLDQFIDEVEVIYLTYLSQLPAAMDIKNAANMISDIVKNCNNRIMINHVSNDEFKAQGNHKFLMMVFKILIHDLPEDYPVIFCDLTETREQEKKINLSFNIKLTLQQLNANERNKLTISCALLNKMGKAYNVSVLAEYFSDDIVQIRMIWEANEA